MKKATKIMKLTKEQGARLPEFVDKWIKIGLSTEPANREKSEKAIRGLYGLAKLNTHESLLLTPGDYIVKRQREYVPEGFRKAQD